MNEFGPEYYDENYYTPGPKNAYNLPYTWQNEAGNFIRKASNIVSQFGPGRVLDVGCGRGFLVKALVMRGVDAHGIDISNWAIQNCEPEARGRLIQCWLKREVAIPAESDSFDLVVSDSVLEHIHEHDIKWVLQEMCRVSSKWVVIDIPVGVGWKNKPWGEPSHQTFYPPAWWIARAYDAGLICDIRLSRHRSTKVPGAPVVFQDARLAFRKDGLDEVVQSC